MSRHSMSFHLLEKQIFFTIFGDAKFQELKKFLMTMLTMMMFDKL